MCCFVSWRKQLQPQLSINVSHLKKNRLPPFFNLWPTPHDGPSNVTQNTCPTGPGNINWTASPVSINIKENQQPAEADTAWSFHTQQGEGGKWGNFDINPFFLVSLLLLLSPFWTASFCQRETPPIFVLKSHTPLRLWMLRQRHGLRQKVILPTFAGFPKQMLKWETLKNFTGFCYYPRPTFNMSP